MTIFTATASMWHPVWRGSRNRAGCAFRATSTGEVRDRTDLAFEDLGDQAVKNIDRPVRVWQWVADGATSKSSRAGHSAPLPRPEKPSIVVLPFDNMSSDSEQGYIADGVVEAITAALSRIRSFFVIARNSAFTYKGRISQRRRHRTRTWRHLRSGRQRSTRRQSSPHHSAVGRDRRRCPCLGRAL